MSRLRQYYANRYSSAEAAQAEFENIIRYINAAEFGNLTLRELLDKIFNDSGNVDLSILFRFDPVLGFQSAVGAGAPWSTITGPDTLRGAPGVSLGSIESPIMFNRVDITATASQQVFPYTIASTTADILVFINGVLQAKDSYTYSQIANTVTLGAAQTVGTKVTIYSVRNNSSSTYRRTDFVAAANQSLFPFVHTDTEEMVVYRNGVLQREGAGFDFIRSSVTGTVTMTTPQPVNTLISVLVVNNSAVRDVLGVMLEDRYATNGLIRTDKIAFADGGLAQAKVTTLVADLALRSDMYVSATTPNGTIRPGSLWVNTSFAVPRLTFYDGVRWLDPSPNGLIPAPVPSDSLKFLRWNSTATALEAATVDFSSLVPVSQKGNPNGVATLDGGGLIPTSQVNGIHRRSLVAGKVGGSVTNGTYPVALLAGNNFSVEAASYKLTAGTATLQLQIGGSSVGLSIAVGTTPVRQTWAAVVANAAASGLDVALVVTAAAGASDLLFGVQGTILS